MLLRMARVADERKALRESLERSAATRGKAYAQEAKAEENQAKANRVSKNTKRWLTGAATGLAAFVYPALALLLSPGGDVPVTRGDESEAFTGGSLSM